MLNIEHSEHKVDATHARINVGKFCYKLLVREIAGITQWNETVDIKHHNEQATNQLNAHLKATIKINTCLMLPGNYARILFSQKNEKHILHLLKSEDQKQNFGKLLIYLRFMDKIFSSNKPLMSGCFINQRPLNLESCSFLVFHMQGGAIMSKK